MFLIHFLCNFAFAKFRVRSLLRANEFMKVFFGDMFNMIKVNGILGSVAVEKAN